MLFNKVGHRLFKTEALQKMESTFASIFALMMFAAIIANVAGFFSLAAFLGLLPFQVTFLMVVVVVLIKFVNFIFYILLASNFMLKVNAISDFYFTIYKRISRYVNLFFGLFFFVQSLRILRIKDVVFAWQK